METWIITLLARRMARTGNSVTVVDVVHRTVADGHNCTGTYDNATAHACLPDTIFLEPAQYDFNPEMERHVYPAICRCIVE